MNRNLKLAAALIFASLALTACGKRGTLEAPGVVEDEGGKPAAASSGAKQAEPHRGTWADGLVR